MKKSFWSKKGRWLVLFCFLVVLSGIAQGVVFVDDFNAISLTDPNRPLIDYELGVVWQLVDHPAGGATGWPGVQNTVVWDGNSALVVDANNSEEMTSLLNKAYKRGPNSNVSIKVNWPIIDDYYDTAPDWLNSGSRDVGIFVCDRMVDKITIGTTNVKGYYWQVDGYSSCWELKRFGTASPFGTKLGTSWNPPLGTGGASAWNYALNFSIRAVPDADGPGTWWEFWYDGNGKDPSDPEYVGPAKFGTDKSNTFADGDLPYFGVAWYAHDASGQTLPMGNHAYISASIDKLACSNAVAAVKDPCAFDDDFTANPMANYQPGLYYNPMGFPGRLTTFDWDNWTDINSVSINSGQIATFLNTQYTREPNSKVSLVIDIPVSAFTESSSTSKPAGLVITNKMLDDNTEGISANCSGYEFTVPGAGPFFIINRIVNGVRTDLGHFNPDYTPYGAPSWWMSHIKISIEPNGTNFDFRLLCGNDRQLTNVPFPNGHILFTDNSGILNDADLKYFGMIVGTGGDEQWNPIRFDRLEVSKIGTRQPACGDYGYFNGDLNSDCYVNMLDLQRFVNNWLEPAFKYMVAEANPLIYAPQISAISVDGDLSDWGSASSWADFGTWYNGGLSSTSRAKYAWNDASNRLYIGIETTEISDPIVEIGGLMSALSTVTPQSGEQATQVSFMGWSGGVPGVVINQADGITDGISAAYQISIGKMTIEIATPIYSNWKDPDTAMDLIARMNIYDYINIANSSYAVADSQVTSGTYKYLYGNSVIGNASLIRLLNTATPVTAEDVPNVVGRPDYNGDSTVNFADFATFALNWLHCNDPEVPCNYVP